MGNAIKFTERGEVVIQVEKESVSGDTASLHFSVRDTGIGIAPEKQKLIFEAFAQADSSTTRKYGGTGPGLSISLRLVEMMKGRIWIESEPGKGSTFHFTAQFSIPSATRQIVPASPSSVKGLRVLAVDDNFTNLRILQRVLTQWGAISTAVRGANEALEALADAQQAGHPFALMITDCHMPEVDGFNLVEEIRKDPGLTGLKVVMLTSGGQRGDAARCRELGVAGYVTKPAQQCELLEMLLQVLGRPASTEARPNLITVHSLREARRSLRILLAEDNPVNQQLATRLFQKRGHTVVVAGDGRQALSALENQQFDLVLMDVQMPEMDGLEATAAIREREQGAGSHLPIIAMTAHTMTGDRERFLAAGMDGYVSKPVRSQELFAAIDGVISAQAEPSAGAQVQPVQSAQIQSQAPSEPEVEALA